MKWIKQSDCVTYNAKMTSGEVKPKQDWWGGLLDSFIVMYVKSWSQLYKTPNQIVKQPCA